MLERAVEVYDKFMEMGFGGNDAAAMIDVIAALPRSNYRGQTSNARTDK
jgi:hypothetical protein